MPLPLKPGENIYIDHKIKEASYAMPAMQAAHDHYTIGYMVSGDRFEPIIKIIGHSQ